jgi:protease IV
MKGTLMKKNIKMAILSGLLTLAFLPGFSQGNIPAYHSYSPFLFLPTEGNDEGLFGYFNPAALNSVTFPDMLLLMNLNGTTAYVPDRWGFFIGFPHFSYGTINTLLGSGTWENRNRFCLSAGTQLLGVGLAYEWTSRSTGFNDPANLLAFGFQAQPAALLSFGVTETMNMSFAENETVATLGIRPFGNDRFTMFADYAFQSPSRWEDLWDRGNASVGALLQPIDGVFLGGKFFPKDMSFQAGVKISYGASAVISQAVIANNGLPSLVVGARYGGIEKSAIHQLLNARSTYILLDLKGLLGYQAGFLESGKPTLLGLLKTIEAAGRDPRVAGLVINTSGFSADTEKLWEMRERLSAFRLKGKRVIIYIDRAELPLYYLASVADRLIMDPVGSLGFMGFLAGSEHFKGTLDKLGIGFEEFRLFTYKSAMESFSRDSMSDAQKTQLKDIIDEKFTLIREEICSARSLKPELFDEIVASSPLLDSDMALKNGLIDGTGRFSDAEKFVKGYEKTPMTLEYPQTMDGNLRPSDTQWSGKPAVAVVYAEGVCAMDTGMNARALQGVILALAEDFTVAAVVVRVDSPGGDAMASDYVAEAVRECALKKPVIVSQGSMAASGGYWVSMYGNTIMASPLTLTGSIGVAGGWFYDAGFKKNLGIAIDFIKAGEHADMGAGFTIPLLNFTIPDRTLSPAEKDMLTRSMQKLYKDFVTKAARGRDKSPDRIEQAAQGRIWTGKKGKDLYLVDELGGLWDAIALARERADIPKDAEIRIEEWPKLPLLTMDSGLPGLVAAKKTDPFAEVLSLCVGNNGLPLTLVDLDLMDYWKK